MYSVAGAMGALVTLQMVKYWNELAAHLDIPTRLTIIEVKNHPTKPFFSSYDTRGQSHAEARHWSDENVLGGRAFFRGDLHPARLVIENVQVGRNIFSSKLLP